MRRVTVIIPVFNQGDLAVDCIASCLHLIDARHDILVMDDASTETGLTERIKGLLADRPGSQLVRNDRNLGFVGTCNRAVLELSDPGTDVLLLNSDTVVTDGFLEEMIACIDLSDRHGVCSPRSDAATICTIPLFTKEMLTAEKRFACWKRLREDLPRYSIAPTGVGFCLLIRRDLIERFGFFDATYGRGYNEENDFCSRLGRFGFSSIIANRAFVFHRGGASFGKEEAALLDARNAPLLEKRYPEFRRNVSAYLERQLPAVDHFGDVLSGAYAKPSILIDLSHTHATYNGTTEYVLSLLPELLPLLTPHANCTILVNPALEYLFHFKKRFPGVLLTSEKIPGRFDLAFVPQQFFSLQHWVFVQRLAVRIVPMMHDVIALRCRHLHTMDTESAFRMTARFADALLSISRYSLEDATSYLEDDLVGNRPRAVIHHGAPAPRGAIKADEPFLLAIGNSYEHKALEPALAHVPTTYRTVVLGSGHSSRRPDVTMLRSGDLPQQTIDDLYGSCQAVLFPSQYEGLGLPMLQAASRGKPIIVQDGPLIDEVVEAYGIGAYVHRFRTFDDIPAILETLKKSPALPPAPQMRTWEQSARETADFLLEMLGRKVDIDLLERRWLGFSTIGPAPTSLDLPSIRQFFASYVGRRLTLFPRIKRGATWIAAKIGLLP
jgi:GT2 family glycosyltransferase